MADRQRPETTIILEARQVRARLRRAEAVAAEVRERVSWQTTATAAAVPPPIPVAADHD